MVDPYGVPSSVLQASTSDFFQEPFDGGGGYSHQFEGDFYREPDDTVRGVSLVAADLADSSLPFHKPFGGFGERDHDFQGMHLSLGDGPSSDPYHDSAGFFGDAPFLKAQDFDGIKNGITTSQAEFVEEYLAPPTPVDNFFQLAVTTLHVMLTPVMLAKSAADIGNCLLFFLGTSVSASIEKVRPQKFWIRADVFLKSDAHCSLGMCTLKIRIYANDNGTFAVEFMRRSGDAVVFHTVFQQASSYLQERMKIVDQVGGDTTPPPPQFGKLSIPILPPMGPPDQFEKEAAPLAPVLDMAAMTEQPLLQAESAATLAEMAEQDVRRAEDLCTEEVFCAIQHLLLCDLMAVAFPTARLLLQLVYCSQAEGFFAQEGVMEEILKKVRSEKDSRSALATNQLAQVFNVSVKRVSKRLSQAAARKLQSELQAALEEVQSKETKQSLRDALLALQTTREWTN